MRTSIILSAVAAVAVSGHVFAESRLPRGLVGFTPATTDGTLGVLGMTKLCQAEFPASRVCTVAEVVQTQKVPAIAEGQYAYLLQSSDSSAFVRMTSDGFFFSSGALPYHVACCAGQPELLGDIDHDGDLDLADSALIRRYLAGEVSVIPGSTAG